MNDANNASPTSPTPSNAGSPNGASPQPSGPVTLDVLSQALAAVNPPEHPSNEDSPPTPTTAANPAAATDPGATLPEEQPLEGNEPPAAGEDLSQLDEQQQGDPFAGLEPDVRAKAIELAKELQAQGLSVGEVKRIGKLLHDKGEMESRLGQQIEALNAKIEELQAGGQAAEANPAIPMPPKVAALKNPAEIERRELHLQSVLDFCEDNPDGGEINGQSFTAEDVKSIRRDARTELRWLPKRGQQLQQAQQFQQVQQQAREQTVKDFPALQDPENPDTKLARQLVSTDPQLAGRPNADYLALALATGHRLLQADLAKRKAPANGTKPAGGQRTRPVASSGGAAVPRANGQAQNVAQLIKTAKERPSPAALEALVGFVQ